MIDEKNFMEFMKCLENSGAEYVTFDDLRKFMDEQHKIGENKLHRNELIKIMERCIYGKRPCCDGCDYSKENAMVTCRKLLEECLEQIKTNGWILCSDRLPTKEECESFKIFQTTINTENSVTVLMNFVYEMVSNKEVGRWIWSGGVSPWEVIAWKPLDEPYREDS